MVLCIISAAFTIALLVVSIAGAAKVILYDCSGYEYYYDYYPSYRRSSCPGMVSLFDDCMAMLVHLVTMRRL